MKTKFAMSPHRSPVYTKFATPLVLEPPRHSGLGSTLLSWGKHLLGTSPDCSVCIRAEGVEPHHAIIVVSEHRTVVKALDPRTWVNEGPVSEMALRPGDRLSIGPLTFRVRAAESDELAAIAVVNERTFDAGASAVAAVMPPVGDSVSTAIVAPSVTTPSELAKVVEEVVVTLVAESRQAMPQSIPGELFSPPAAAPVNIPTRFEDVSAVDVTPNETLDFRTDEIEQKLAALEQPSSACSTSTDDGTARMAALETGRRQLLVRQNELQQRADELARQSQQLHERVARVVEREADFEQRQARLATEHEQIAATAEVTRKELDDEYARHRTLWQEWDAAYRRTSGELNSQLQSMEQRRTALLVDGDHLAGERSELQRLQDEHERDRRVHAAERVQLTTDRAALQSLRADFETERHQHLVAVQEREAQVVAERRTLSATQAELLGTRQQLERDRTEFLALRSTEARQREQELREHIELRERLGQEHARIQTEQLKLNELRRAVEAERTAVVSERSAFDSQQAAVAADRTELNRLRERLHQVESDLIQWQTRHDVQRSVPPTDMNSETAAQAPSLDWISEPYKYIHTPPPVPADWSNESSLVVAATAGTAPAQCPAEILPLPHAIPATLDDPPGAETPGDALQRTAIATLESQAEFVRGDQVVSDGGLTPRVTAPAAASHRFWEDNTLYDTSVGMHLQHHVPATPMASSHVPNASGAAPTVAMPLAAVASGTAFAMNPEGSFVTEWSRSLETATPDVAAQPETVDSTATATADADLTVDETLAEINRQFGIPFPTQDVSPTTESAVAMPGWWTSVNAVASSTVDDEHSTEDPSNSTASRFTHHSVELPEPESVAASDRTSSTTTNADDPLSSLRAQLAQLFDLPAQAAAEHDATTDSADAAVDEEVSPEDHDYMELTLAPTAGDVSGESPPTDMSNYEPDSNETSLIVNEVLVSTGLESSTDLARPATTAETEENNEAEDSIEDYMARLLSRSRGGAEISVSEVTSLTKSAALTMSPSGREVASNGESAAADTSFDPADRSHLTAEPKHKQNRQAVREDLQSFRQVAHQSARSALARHTTKNLLSAVVAKSMLLGVSALATTAFVLAPLVGFSTQRWKGGACFVATVLSAILVYRSWRELRRWKTTGELPKKNTAQSAVSPTAASEAAAQEAMADALPATATAE